jgi:hypothetical protein
MNYWLVAILDILLIISIIITWDILLFIVLIIVLFLVLVAIRYFTYCWSDAVQGVKGNGKALGIVHLPGGCQTRIRAGDFYEHLPDWTGHFWNIVHKRRHLSKYLEKYKIAASRNVVHYWGRPILCRLIFCHTCHIGQVWKRLTSMSEG